MAHAGKQAAVADLSIGSRYTESAFLSQLFSDKWYDPVARILYGIRNCDTMKKARTWLDQHGVAYQFHDYRIAGIDRARLEHWSSEVGWEVLLNRAGTTFRKLPEDRRCGLDARRAIALMLEQPSMIKRPVLELPGKIVVGFKPQTYADLFTS